MKKNPCVRTSMYLSAALAAGFVITTSQIHAVEILAVDFGTATSPVESGFVGQSATSATHTTTAGDITVAISGQQGTFDYAPPNTTGSNTDLYRDFFFKNGTNNATGTMILILSGPGISASTDYVLGFWTQYQPPFSPPPVRPTALSTAFTPKANS